MNSAEPQQSATSSSNLGHVTPTPNALPYCQGPPPCLSSWHKALSSPGGERGSLPPIPAPHALCLASHGPPQRARGLAHFPPKHHLPLRLRATRGPAAPRRPGRQPSGPACRTLLLPSSVPLPAQGLRDFPERQGGQGQGDRWAPGEARPGRRKKMAEPSFHKAPANARRMRGLAAGLGPTLITERASTSPEAPSSP